MLTKLKIKYPLSDISNPKIFMRLFFCCFFSCSYIVCCFQVDLVGFNLSSHFLELNLWNQCSPREDLRSFLSVSWMHYQVGATLNWTIDLCFPQNPVVEIHFTKICIWNACFQFPSPDTKFQQDHFPWEWASVLCLSVFVNRFKLFCRLSVHSQT